MSEIAVAVLLTVGVTFSLSGAVGTVRMPDVYTRLQCSSKTTTSRVDFHNVSFSRSEL